MLNLESLSCNISRKSNGPNFRTGYMGANVLTVTFLVGGFCESSGAFVVCGARRHRRHQQRFSIFLLYGQGRTKGVVYVHARGLCNVSGQSRQAKSKVFFFFSAQLRCCPLVVYRRLQSKTGLSPFGAVNNRPAEPKEVAFSFLASKYMLKLFSTMWSN